MGMDPTGVILDTGDIVRLVVYTKLGDQAGINVLHYQVLASPPDDSFDMSLIGDSWDAQTMYTKYRTVMNESSAYAGIGLRRVWPDETIEFFYTVGAGAGAAEGDTLPTQVCGLIKKKSSMPGHGRAGRIYIPFPSEGDSDAVGKPRVAYQDALQDIVTGLVAFRNVALDKLINMVMYRYPRTTPTVVERRVTPVERLIVSDRWATQRRRGDYGRLNILPI